jgi:Cu-Zn family superoxide dismutase
MEFRKSIVRVSLCGLLFTLPACGGERNERDKSSADQPNAAPGIESAEVARARATIAGPPGSGIEGEVTLTESRGNFPEPGVQIEARITGPAAGLALGRHGFHIHENAKGGCVPPYTSAGGHFDPGPAGNPDPDVNHPFHTGDIPNLVVDGNGVGTLNAITSRITLSPGPLSIMDENGSSIIVHEEADQGISGPAKSGVSGGARIACGVIERSP